MCAATWDDFVQLTFPKAAINRVLEQEIECINENVHWTLCSTLSSLARVASQSIYATAGFFTFHPMTDGLTKLHHACFAGDVELVRFLLV